METFLNHLTVAQTIGLLGSLAIIIPWALFAGSDWYKHN